MLNFKQPTWAHAELFGHSSYFCRAQEVNFCGSQGLAIEPVTVDGILPAFFAAGAAIFRLTPMSEDDVRHAVLPRAFRACDAFQPAPVLPTSCRACGRDEPEHEEERQRKALPPSPRAESPIPDASFEEGDDDIPFDAVLDDGIQFDDLEDYAILVAVRLPRACYGPVMTASTSSGPLWRHRWTPVSRWVSECARRWKGRR